jgi:hypothetical protein
MGGSVPQTIASHAQALFEHLFEASPDAVAVTDPLGRLLLLTLNSSCLRTRAQ